MITGAIIREQTSTNDALAPVHALLNERQMSHQDISMDSTIGWPADFGLADHFAIDALGDASDLELLSPMTMPDAGQHSQVGTSARLKCNASWYKMTFRQATVLLLVAMLMISAVLQVPGDGLYRSFQSEPGTQHLPSNANSRQAGNDNSRLHHHTKPWCQCVISLPQHPEHYWLAAHAALSVSEAPRWW